MLLQTHNFSCPSVICWKGVWMGQYSFIVIVVFHFTPITLLVVEWHLAILCLRNNEKSGRKMCLIQWCLLKSKYFHNDYYAIPNPDSYDIYVFIFCFIFQFIYVVSKPLQNSFSFLSSYSLKSRILPPLHPP